MSRHSSDVRTPVRNAKAAAALLCCAALGACSTTGAPAAAPRGVERFPSFPGEAVCGDVIVEARFYRDHAVLLSEDFAKRFDVLPIALRIGLGAQAKSKVRFSPEDSALKLILADGTPLSPVSPRELAGPSPRLAQRAASLAAEAAWLGDWQRAADEFVFFALAPAGDFHVAGAEVRHKSGGVVRKLDLDRSLVAFEVEVDGERRSVRVGVKLDNAVKLK